MPHSFEYKLIGTIFLAIGVLVRYRVGRRRFDRRNFTGMQRFRSYDESIMSRYSEGPGRTIATVMILLGALMLFFGFL